MKQNVLKKKPDMEEPLRSELFGVERMQQHSKILAKTHRLCHSSFRNDKLLTRLVENESVLNDVRDLLTEAAAQKRRMYPAGDWLLDNFYLIQEHIYTSKRDLPKGYSRGLPSLLDGQSAGLPRVYDIALERISHGDGLVDPNTLLGFLDSYQSVSVLTNGELWAIPIMFRLALIENLRRIAVRISAGMQAQSEADSWAERMTESAESEPKNLILLIADMARSDPPMVSSFVAELARKLQGKGAALALPLTWIEQRLSETGLTIEQLVQSALQQQAADQVSISNNIVALRSLGATNWKKIIESTSIVDRILRKDPSAFYGKMDFDTRDRYRHAVEEIARKGRVTEEAVAGYALQLAQEAAQSSGKKERVAHIGFYLIDKGVKALLQRAHLHSFKRKTSRPYGSKALVFSYIASLVFWAAVFVACFFALAQYGGALDLWSWLMLVPAYIAASGLSIALLNYLTTLFVSPHILPCMDFSGGIPDGQRTLVVVPAMLSSAQTIDALAESLEIRFLANRDDNVFFGLLTDFTDSHTQIEEEDSILLSLVQQRLEALNIRYKGIRGEPFFLFHRPRTWNDRERIWMGYERKRGKLADLNALLRGGGADSFQSIIGSVERLQSVKYVITLDVDTQLPRDSARHLVGIMAHPLNQAVYDEKLGRIVDGYGILQPRIAAKLPEAQQSYYAALNDSEPGIDPYTRAVSDVYQDLFGEGSFIGKGIYDVTAFERSLKGRFPENRILSHDLLEGAYARSALISTVQLYEKSPSTYHADTKRRLRWMRGDWQIASWLFPAVPSFEGSSRKNALSALSKFKIFDNLRRSLMAPSLMFLLLFGWLRFSIPLIWTVSVLGVLLIPPVLISLFSLFRKSLDTPMAAHLRITLQGFLNRVAQAVFSIVCLPYEALSSLATICKTLFRVHILHRHLLEWIPSNENNNDDTRLSSSLRAMAAAPVLAAATALLLYFLQPLLLPLLIPLLAVWFFSPLIVWASGRPQRATVSKTSSEQNEFLGRIARKTWSFFQTFVTEAENWLPPDNFQANPNPVIAHRSSPTNMGLALLANLSAYDLGYISTGRLLERTDCAINSMMKLEQYRRHFYNWYDTLTLQPLSPRYISTVDSGNLAAHLMTLNAGLAVLADDALVSKRIWEALHDVELILRPLIPASSSVFARFSSELAALRKDPPYSLLDARLFLDRLLQSAVAVRDMLETSTNTLAQSWADALVQQIVDTIDELQHLAPYLSIDVRVDEQAAYIIKGAIPSLRGLQAQHAQLLQELASSRTGTSASAFEQLVQAGYNYIEERYALIDRLLGQVTELSNMDFAFLYSKRRRLFSIGYNVDRRRRDAGYYDLLASEARLTSFIAIAQDQVPQEHWFALGRTLANVGGKSVLFSWSGSMFEYLMSNLVMPVYENTLLHQSCRRAIERQIEYGKQRGVPWGISESGYNAFDVLMNYQYRAFGVPGLGLKSGLVEDLVLAPYATALALLLMPAEACSNLERLSEKGFEGDYGFYEAIDYTKSRLASGQSWAIIHSFMAHHQGMSLLSFASHLLGQPMRKRFESLPFVQGTSLLLEEKIPKATKFSSHLVEIPEFRAGAETAPSFTRLFTSPQTTTPEIHLLSNGRYHVMLSNAGGGYSRWNDLALTRWIEDSTRDNWGTYVFLRDIGSGQVWSSTFQPSCTRSNSYEAIFSEGRAEFFRREDDLEIHTEIAVSPEDDIELRRVRLINRSRERRVFELTSYAEIVLAPPASDLSHPGFSNLFVQTEILDKLRTILCTRRRRSDDEQSHSLMHLMTAQDAEIIEVSYETDRLRFIGRGNSIADANAMEKAGPLSDTSGSVLDPIVSIRLKLVVEGDSTATVDIISGISDTRSSTVLLAEKYQDKCFANRVFELARTHSQVILQQINGTERDAQLYNTLAASILYAHSRLRAPASVIMANRRGQSGLWGYSISGDLPIVLLQIKDSAHIELVRQLVQAHSYWRQKGLVVDLLIWNEEPSGYRQQLHNQILGLIAAGANESLMDRSGGIFVRSAEQIADEDRVLIKTTARIIISDSRGSLEEQASGVRGRKLTIPLLIPARIPKNRKLISTPTKRDLIFFNGHGGFSPDGREYIITLAKGQVTPAPWSNVLANADFGTVVSEAGMAYTWCENAHEFRISPWHDDPVSDVSGEALYIRDEESGQYWSPCPLPCRGETPYVTRHGFGYTVFEHSEWGIRTELWVYVAVDAPLKFALLKVTNESGATRRLSATSYVELVLGEHRTKSAMHVISEVDSESGAVFARNHYSREFAERVVFLSTDSTTKTVTGDRSEFIGRNGSLKNPAAMKNQRLSGVSGAALDPCVAIQVPFELADGMTRELVFTLGCGRDAEEARQLLSRFAVSGAAYGALERVWQYWRRTLDAVHVETPDPALNVLANGWLMYQVLSSRMWARSGYYQSGGAFGYRDQLQDAMSLVHTEPGLLRKQLLLCAEHQFVEGDVQHWWHPPGGRGSRSHCSDDYLWLPLAVCRYVSCTGDQAVLDEMIPFLQGEPVKPDEESNYDLPYRSEKSASLYDHCSLAIRYGRRRGVHGLPLIGSGDWNDGMNRVGENGKGESVWLAFFMYDVLTRFKQLSLLHGDRSFSDFCQREATELQEKIEAEGWDGQWYRRAYFDDGSPLGSALNSECQIDSISQSWAVLSNAGDAERSSMAMESLDTHLVRRDKGLIQLLDPPFDTSMPNPGYIRGYVPGIRENGGQYTHAAIWTIMAFAQRGDSQRAWELFKMINPIHHSSTLEKAEVYKVEPYVMSADIYSTPPHTGRGGWTWYTGSAGWMYRLIVESLLGISLQANRLHITPLVPAEWEGFSLQYHYRESLYHIAVKRVPAGDTAAYINLDGVDQAEKSIALADDRGEHHVEVRIST